MYNLATSVMAGGVMDTITVPKIPTRMSIEAT